MNHDDDRWLFLCVKILEEMKEYSTGQWRTKRMIFKSKYARQQVFACRTRGVCWCRTRRQVFIEHQVAIVKTNLAAYFRGQRNQEVERVLFTVQKKLIGLGRVLILQQQTDGNLADL